MERFRLLKEKIKNGIATKGEIAEFRKCIRRFIQDELDTDLSPLTEQMVEQRNNEFKDTWQKIVDDNKY